MNLGHDGVVQESDCNLPRHVINVVEKNALPRVLA